MTPARFWAKTRVTPSGCIEWMGYRNRAGYGQVGVDHKLVLAHRYAYTLAKGAIPAGDVIQHVVCHNPPCVNVEHLATGTQTENLWQMRQEGRTAKGEHHSRAKITEVDVRHIRALRQEGVTVPVLARVFGLSQGAVTHICTRRSWKHVA